MCGVLAPLFLFVLQTVSHILFPGTTLAFSYDRAEFLLTLEPAFHIFFDPVGADQLRRNSG
jgi:hypothetical protein